MIEYSTTILKFGEQGEKTGWTYIVIPADIAQAIKADNKKTFRVKGKLDAVEFSGIAAMPMGDGTFILPLKADIRKRVGKRHGAMIRVQLQEDSTPFIVDDDFMECLMDEPLALEFFKQLTMSHQRYFNNWITSAKGIETKSKRIAQSVNALFKKQNYGQMIRWLKENKSE